MVCLDDILVTGASEEEHQANLKAVLRRLAEAVLRRLAEAVLRRLAEAGLRRLAESGLRLMKDKGNFGVVAVEYLGHRISKDGLATLDKRVRAAVEAPTTTDVTQVKSFIGMLTFYLRFLPNLATILQSLHQLLKKDHVLRWGTDQERAFNMAKELLRKAPVLTRYVVNKPLLLTCDASSYGVGAVLAHQTEDIEQPVAFHPRTMAPAKNNYSQIEKDMWCSQISQVSMGSTLQDIHGP